MTNLALVPEDKSEWLRCRPWIEEAVKDCLGTHTIEDVEDGIESGEFLFFSMQNCAVIVRIMQYPRKRAVNYFLVGGDLNELKNKMEPHITAWAKSKGCNIAVLIGREGWLRTLSSLGFRKMWSATYKEI